MPVYVQALLEQTAESLESLQRTLARGEEGRIATNTHLLALAEKIGALTDQMRAGQELMSKLAESQNELRPVLARLADAFPRQRRAHSTRRPARTSATSTSTSPG